MKTDDSKPDRKGIFLISGVAAVIGIFWTYLAVHYWGIAVGLPWAQYDESWALPASAVVLGVGVILYFVLFRSAARR